MKVSFSRDEIANSVDFCSPTEVTNLVMEIRDLVGEDAVLVHQEAEAPLLLQQSLLAAVSDELLHVHLMTSEGLKTLQRQEKGSYQLSDKLRVHGCVNMTSLFSVNLEKHYKGTKCPVRLNVRHCDRSKCQRSCIFISR